MCETCFKWFAKQLGVRYLWTSKVKKKKWDSVHCYVIYPSGQQRRTHFLFFFSELDTNNDFLSFGKKCQLVIRSHVCTVSSCLHFCIMWWYKVRIKCTKCSNSAVVLNLFLGMFWRPLCKPWQLGVLEPEIWEYVYVLGLYVTALTKWDEVWGQLSGTHKFSYEILGSDRLPRNICAEFFQTYYFFVPSWCWTDLQQNDESVSQLGRPRAQFSFQEQLSFPVLDWKREGSENFSNDFIFVVLVTQCYLMKCFVTIRNASFVSTYNWAEGKNSWRELETSW